jgi:hypothetical protein
MPDGLSDDLLRQVRQKRAQLDAFLARKAPLKRRLMNVTILGGTLATALTAGPAVGGPGFTAWLTKTFGLTSPSWQLLCGGAALCSVSATIATQILKSNNVEENVTRAQGCRAKLEVLEVGLTIGQLDLSHATTEYMRCVEESAFLEPV